MKSWLSTCPGYSVYFCLNSEGGLDTQNARMSQKPPPTCLQDQKGPKQHLSLPNFKHDSVIQQMSPVSPSTVSLQV